MVFDSDGNCTLPATFEELKNYSGFKTIDATGILTVELSAGTQYTLQVTSDGFNGQCDAEVDIYNLY